MNFCRFVEIGSSMSERNIAMQILMSLAAFSEFMLQFLDDCTNQPCIYSGQV
jgi:hypothetical protein